MAPIADGVWIDGVWHTPEDAERIGLVIAEARARRPKKTNGAAAPEKTPAERAAAFREYADEAERRAAAEGRDLQYEAEQAVATYGIVRASTIVEEPTSWLWEGFFPWGELSITEGDPDVGKTTLLLSVIAAVTTGTQLPFGRAGSNTPADALYFTAEDSIAKTIVPRLKAAGADLERVHVQKAGAAELLLPGAVENLRAIVRATGSRIVALDPLNAFLDASEVNVNREQEVRHALRPLRDLAEGENLVLVGQRHLNKNTDRPSLYRGGGSIGLAAVARSVVLVAKHPEDAGLRVVASQKCNLCAEDKKVPRAFRIGKDDLGRPRLEWLALADTPAIDVDELLAPRKPGPKADTLETAKRYLADLLTNGPKLRRDVLEAGAKVRLNEKAIQRAANALGVRSEAHGRERLWSLP